MCTIAHIFLVEVLNSTMHNFTPLYSHTYQNSRDALRRVPFHLETSRLYERVRVCIAVFDSSHTVTLLTSQLELQSIAPIHKWQMLNNKRKLKTEEIVSTNCGQNRNFFINNMYTKWYAVTSVTQVKIVHSHFPFSSKLI